MRARGLLESLDEWALSAVQSVTMECKSLLIALALVLRKTTVENVRKFLGVFPEMSAASYRLLKTKPDLFEI